MARFQRGVTSRYALQPTFLEETFFARSSLNFASILHSAKILDGVRQSLPFFHAPSKTRQPPLSPNQADAFEWRFPQGAELASQPNSRVRNSFNDRLLRPPATPRLPADICPPSIVHPILYVRKRKKQNRWTEFESDSRGVTYFSITIFFEPRCGNKLREEKERGRGERKEIT